MTIADSNRGRLAYKAETAFNTAPSGDYQILRITQSDFGAQKETTVSNEIRSDRMAAGLMETAATAGGSFGFELSLGGTFDDLLEAALCGTWSTELSASNVEAIAGNKFSLTAGFADAQVGQWVYASGFTNSANNGWHKVTAVTANDITVETTLTVEAAAVGHTVKGKSLRNGTMARSFAVEEAFLDVGQFFQYLGQRVGSFSLDASAGQVVTGSFGFQGASSAFDTSTFAGNPVAATTTLPINATANAGKIVEGNTLAELATAIQGFNLNLDNALRNQMAVGSKYPVGIGYGRQTVSGSINAYFENTALYEKFLNHAATALAFSFSDAAGNRMRIMLPKVYFTTSNPSMSGIDQDVMEALEWTAISNGSYQIQIDMVKAS